MATEFQGDVILALNDLDVANRDLLEQVVTSAAAEDSATGDVTADDLDAANIEECNAAGYISWGGQVGSVGGTAGVSILEFAKDAIQTTTTNVSGMGTQQKTMNTIVERKVAQG